MADTAATLFIPGNSRLHGLHPFNKLIYLVLIGVTAYLGPGGGILNLLLMLWNLGVAAASGVGSASWRLLWRTLLPLTVFMLAIHGLLNPANQTVLFRVGGVAVYEEGIRFAVRVLLQLAAVLSASLLFVFSTHPADLITALTQAGWPPGLAYVFGSPLLLLPAMRGRIGAIQSAQRARGLETEGNLLKRLRALFPLAAPLVLGAFVEVEQRSIALEMRAFNTPGPKTSWRVVPDSNGQRAARWLMLALAIAVVLRRVWS